LDLAPTHTLHVYHFVVILVKGCLTMMLVLAVSTCTQKFTRVLWSRSQWRYREWNCADTCSENEVLACSWK